ncbi:MAG: hypothetical protein F4Y81_01795 [Rhodothermaceae bacterium]|nr:hypothetical protein [Rhodothermaceae bacterium]MYG68478.1 hypothetical protein [Rhodothermaceae bacterium]
MHDPPDYDAREQAAWRKNFGAVIDRLNARDDNILKTIRTYIWRFGYSESEVSNHIREDQMFAAWFAKEPRRTKFHEKIAAEWLRRIEQESDLINGFKELATGGRKAWYIASDGDLRQGKKPPGIKSLDFKWKTGNYTIYASHKYTKEGGGNQDSQFNEVLQLLKHFQQRSNGKYDVVLAIVDGPYFTETKMEQLYTFERMRPPYSKALPIQDVPDFLANLPDQ